MLDVEIYPIWKTQVQVRRAKTKKSREAQQRQNAKNARRKLIRKINDNVFESDPAETEVMMKYRIAHSCGCPEKKMKLILWEYQDRSIIEYRRPTYPLPEELHPEYPLMTENEFLSWRLPLQK